MCRCAARAERAGAVGAVRRTEREVSVGVGRDRQTAAGATREAVRVEDGRDHGLGRVPPKREGGAEHPGGGEAVQSQQRATGAE